MCSYEAEPVHRVESPAARSRRPRAGAHGAGSARTAARAGAASAAIMSAEVLRRGLKYGASTRVFALHHSSGRSSMLRSMPFHDAGREKTARLDPVVAVGEPQAPQRRGGDRGRVPGVADAAGGISRRRSRNRSRAAACRPNSALQSPPIAGGRQAPMCRPRARRCGRGFPY